MELQPSLIWQCTAANFGRMITIFRVYQDSVAAHPETGELLASTMLQAQLPDMRKLYKSMASSVGNYRTAPVQHLIS